MEAVTLSDKQQRRARVIERLCSGILTTGEAASLLHLSDRQVRRLKNAFMQSGFHALVHGNTKRPPANRTSSRVVQEAVRLCGSDGPYHDFNVCHAKQVLEEHHHLAIGRSTLDRLLKENGTRKPHRRKPQVKRSRRVRSACEGQMIQIDGSPHDWLEGRAPRMCLMGAIDDATNQVVYARFHPTEDQKGYLMLLRSVAIRYGIPMSVYHDKHTILRSPKEPTLEEELAGVKPMSQVQRVMETLGIEAIAANSPQAKGRVERLWKTLQDRLTKEMRLAGINTLEDANDFLTAYIERHNRRYAVPSRESAMAWVPHGERQDLARLFSTMEVRTVANDHTVSVAGTTYQILRRSADKSLSGRRIAVHVTPEEEIHFYHGGNRLEHMVCAPNTTVPDRATVTVVPEAYDIVQIALEHRRNSFKAHRGLAPLSQQTPPNGAST